MYDIAGAIKERVKARGDRERVDSFSASDVGEGLGVGGLEGSEEGCVDDDVGGLGKVGGGFGLAEVGFA